MVSFREVSVADTTAHALLAEYFDARARSFPVAQGNYHTAFPSPEQFVPPRGVFLLVEGVDLSGKPAGVGCGGIRHLEPDVAGPAVYEVKHLWVQPHTRGLGFGRALLEELEARARGFGAERLVLDTNASLEAAAGLYRSSGYHTIVSYNDNPNATHWYAKSLVTSAPHQSDQ
jgi:ribosomal protein S18 acetylase RimI-like enzyme